MNIASISPASFKGIWRQETYKATSTKNIGVDNIYVQSQTYHPFTDEVVSPEIKKSEGVSGVKYLEYRSDDDNYGAEDKSISIKDVKIGARLDITESEYNELSRVKKAGEEANKKLKGFGEVKNIQQKLATRPENDATTVLEDVDTKTINKILAGIDFVA